MRWKTEKEGAPLILAKTAARLSWKRQFKEWLPSIVDAGGAHIIASSRLPAQPLVRPRRDHGQVRTSQLPIKCPLCVAKGEQRDMEGTALSEAVIFSLSRWTCLFVLPRCHRPRCATRIPSKAPLRRTGGRMDSKKRTAKARLAAKRHSFAWRERIEVEAEAKLAVQRAEAEERRQTRATHTESNRLTANKEEDKDENRSRTRRRRRVLIQPVQFEGAVRHYLSDQNLHKDLMIHEKMCVLSVQRLEWIFHF